MLELLGHLDKSAASNNAGIDEQQAMLAPLLAALGERGLLPASKDTGDGATAALPGAGSVEASLPAGQRAALHLANHASLKVLTAALLGRLEAQQEQLKAATDHG